jgi:transcriptional regulator with XRE-family HTH domain
MGGAVNAAIARRAPLLQGTSTELARRSHIHRQTICKLEKGGAQPQRKTLARITSALAVGGVEFIGGGVLLASG